MKVKVNLTNQTLECLDNKPYIQGYDTRNKLIVYVDASVTLTNIQIAYQLQNGRNTIKLPNNGIVEATLEDETTPNPDYIEGYNGFIFNAFTNAGEPLAVTNQAGNFTATLVFKVGGNTYKLNVLNTVLKSTDFEEFENAVEGVAQEVLFSLESMSDIVTELQQTVDDIAANDFSEDEAKEIFYTKTQSDSKYAKFKLITNIANIPAETLASLEVGDILVSSGYAYMVLKGLQAQNSAYNRFIYGIEDISTLKVYWYEKTSVSGTDWYLRVLTYPLARYSSTDKLNADYIADGTNNKVFTGTEKTKLSGIEAGAEVNVVEGVKVNGTAQTPDANKIISLTIPTSASDVNALPNTTKYCASCDLEINSSTYVMSLQLKDQDGNNLGAAKTVDLPLETMVVSGSYDSATKKVVLTLQNGSTVEFSVADLVSGLQTEITAQNKLSSDLVDDTGHTHKFVNADEKSVIDNIGYLELSAVSDDSSNPSSLTNEQVAEMQKKYCIIKYNGDWGKAYYKNRTGGNLVFFEPLNYETQSNNGNWMIFEHQLIVDTINKTIYYQANSLITGCSISKVNTLATEIDTINNTLNSVQTTTDTTANIVEVPTSAKGLATFNKLGGMSYKCNNLFDIPTKSQTSSSFLINGYVFPKPLLAGTYTISFKCSGTTYQAAQFQFFDANDNIITDPVFAIGNNNSFTINITSDCYSFSLYSNEVGIYTDFMLNEGSTALPYEAYYEGIRNSAVTKLVSVGTNKWDEEWEVGGISTSNGGLISNSTDIRSKNYIKVKPNTTYYFAKPNNKDVYILFYDANDNVISYTVSSNDTATVYNKSAKLSSGNNGGKFTTPTSCSYVLFTVDSLTTYNHDICINVSNADINGQYFKYEKHELAIPSEAQVSRGINDSCYDYIDFATKTKHVKTKVLTNLRWSYNADYGIWLSSLISDLKNRGACLSTNYNAVTSIVESLSVGEVTTYWSWFGDSPILLVKNGSSTIQPSGDFIVELNEETITDISSLLGEVHIPIEANGTLEPVNTYGNAVPMSVTFDNGLADMVKTNHNHDIEQQKEIDKLEQYNASKESILDKMSYNPATGKLEIRLGNSSDKAEISLNTDRELVLKAHSSDISETTVSLDENKIVLKYQTDFEEDNITHTLKLDGNGLTYDGSRLDAYYIHNITVNCNSIEAVEELRFKLLRRTATPLTLADLKSEEVSYLKAFDIVARIKNGSGIWFYSPTKSMSFYDSSETTLAFNVSITYQQNDKTLDEDGIDIAVAEVISVDDTVREL